MTQFDWTDDRVETLKRLWAEGLSCSQIAGRMGGGLSRNAVIGKVHRMGLNKRAEAKRYDRMPATIISGPRRTAKPQRAFVPVIKSAPLPPAEPALTGAEPTLTDLTGSMCRWPVGEADGWQQRFRGAPKDGEGSYCAFHASKSINPQARKASTGMLSQMGRRSPMVMR